MKEWTSKRRCKRW